MFCITTGDSTGKRLYDGEENIRIVSAREADQRERRVYLEQAAY
jgi:uncharacterized DUF497 family protein